MAQPVRLETIDHDSAMDETANAVRVTQVAANSVGSFGKPTLMSANNGRAKWARGDAVLSTHQKSSTGWVAKLYGGKQTLWDDWAALYIPVNELPLTNLSSALWTWFNTGEEAMGVNMVIWVHDPTDNDKRAEMTQLASHADLQKSAGWDGHELNVATDYFSYLGEGISGSGLTAGTNYGLDDFQADALFKNWTIYRISFEWGWHTGDFIFENVYIADVKLNKQVIPLKPSVEEQLDIVRDDQADALRSISTWTFGEPTLQAVNNSDAVWSRGYLPSQFQKSTTGWLANLYGGVQTDDDFASVVIPVNELPVPDLASAMWTYYMTAAEAAGVNIVVWVHDPADFSLRAEITQTMGKASKASGWNKEALDLTATEMFYYGEISGTPDTTPTPGTEYTWAQFQGDNVFSKYTIYRITLDYGWIASSTLDDVWVADIKINGQVIPLKPDSGGSGRIGHRFFTDTSGAIDETLAPKTPFRLLSVKLHLNAAGTQQTFTLTCDAGRAANVYDTLLYTKDMAGIQDIVVPFGVGYEFLATDEIDPLWTNTDAKTYGLTYSYQTVF